MTDKEPQAPRCAICGGELSQCEAAGRCVGPAEQPATKQQGVLQDYDRNDPIVQAIERGYQKWEEAGGCESSCGCVTVWIHREIAALASQGKGLDALLEVMRRIAKATEGETGIAGAVNDLATRALASAPATPPLPSGWLQPIASNVPLDEHAHKPEQFCRGCADLTGWKFGQTEPVRSGLFHGAPAKREMPCPDKHHDMGGRCWTCGEIPDKQPPAVGVPGESLTGIYAHDDESPRTNTQQYLGLPRQKLLSGEQLMKAVRKVFHETDSLDGIHPGHGGHIENCYDCNQFENNVAAQLRAQEEAT